MLQYWTTQIDNPTTTPLPYGTQWIIFTYLTSQWGDYNNSEKAIRFGQNWYYGKPQLAYKWLKLLDIFPHIQHFSVYLLSFSTQTCCWTVAVCIVINVWQGSYNRQVTGQKQNIIGPTCDIFRVNHNTDIDFRQRWFHHELLQIA